MRCYCCNRKLNDFEATRRSAHTGDFLDMCNKCLQGLDIATVDREDLQNAGERTSIYEDPDYLELDAFHEVHFPVIRGDSEE